jgi:hypothetical protein
VSSVDERNHIATSDPETIARAAARDLTMVAIRDFIRTHRTEAVAGQDVPMTFRFCAVDAIADFGTAARLPGAHRQLGDGTFLDTLDLVSLA